MACKHGNTACPDYYYCGKCTRERREEAWRRMTPAQRDYDRHVDPLGAYTSGLSAPCGDAHLWSSPATGCSCHISPPCAYCTSKASEDDS